MLLVPYVYMSIFAGDKQFYMADIGNKLYSVSAYYTAKVRACDQPSWHRSKPCFQKPTRLGPDFCIQHVAMQVVRSVSPCHNQNFSCHSFPQSWMPLS